MPQLASKGVALAKGPLHAMRGTSEEEKLLKNAKSEFSEEHGEIATYTAIETLAEAVGDTETAKLARAIRRDEERMAKYLEGLIPTLTKAVAKAEIPSAERSDHLAGGGATPSMAAGPGRARAAGRGRAGRARRRARAARIRSGSC